MDAFEQGKIAFKAGQQNNPYKTGSNNYRNWEHGFNKAYFDNLQKEDTHKKTRQNA